MKSANHDLEKLFDQIRHRFDEVGLGFSKVEVRFEHLRVECFVQVGSRALPTVPNYICNIVEAVVRRVGLSRKRVELNDVVF
ncbi:hypothetical protein QN277_019229 [Acacia crassicarpa]|uniref:Pleiotropic ABC efflux transporter N-terminal domain-containing protein n=1 Tax=Acacia crassicarpa TaxID=499986 RepID=A0AAE1JTE8_9FABA|nr:hypothetical protein QN277_019229 [Acacia crassicarpa]